MSWFKKISLISFIDKTLILFGTFKFFKNSKFPSCVAIFFERYQNISVHNDNEEQRIIQSHQL